MVKNMDSMEIIKVLREFANPENVQGMARFGIASENTLGVSMPIIRQIAKDVKKNHQLALELWDSGIHEAKILAALVAEAKLLTESEMDKWVAEFDSWDVCDQVCGNLFDKSQYFEKKIFEWAIDEREFVRRAAFALIAYSAVHHKKRNDDEYLNYAEIIIKYSNDDRNFVRKAVNWAIRQIGKRSHYLNKKAQELCCEILNAHPNSKSAKWIVSDAMRELKDEKIIARINR